jgi:DNA invertase Pin-like site-specific DNA recombinase
MNNNRFVVYYRLSLVKPGTRHNSGLGLDAQRAMFESFCASRPGVKGVEVLGEYTEIETGKTLKKSLKRPELVKAIAHARAANATLVVARLDRLARNVAFISALIESKLPFICCDVPNVDNFTIHILAAVAEREGNLISERTSAALQALKLRGVKLGSAREGHWDGLAKRGGTRLERRALGLAKAHEVSREVIQEEMSNRYEPLVPWIRELRESGRTYQEILAELNGKGCLTRRGKPWNMATLHRVISKYLGSKYLGNPNHKLIGGRQ